MSEPTSPLRVLIVDDEANIRITLGMCLEADGHTVTACGGIDEAREQIARQVFDLVFLDLRLGMDNGLDFLPQLRAESPWARVVVITAYASIETAVEAMRRGATDYLPKPFDAAQVQLLTEKLAERRQLERKITTLQSQLGELDAEADLATNSPALRQALELARQVASSRASVLIHGEPGVGKRRLARAIHAWSQRAAGPLLTVSCQVDSESLDVELFGVALSHVIGNGAEHIGKVCLCDTGTLVLEEVGRMPVRLQPKLLQLLQDRQYERMNEAHPRPVDVRVIATAADDLSHMAERGKFRSDLLLALNVVQIDLPPLRDRPEDIAPLAERYTAFFARQNQRIIAGISADALDALQRYHWPGNLRELRNVMERAVLLCGQEQIELGHFPPNLLNSSPAYAVGDLVPLETIKRMHIMKVSDSTRSIRRAAAILGIDASTLCRLLKRYESRGDQPAA